MSTTILLEVTANEAKSTPQHIDQNGQIFELPDFTMKQIYDAIPRHCFKPSMLRSISYVLRDFSYLVILVYITKTFTPLIQSLILRILCYAAYTTIAGMVLSGIWNIGHEAGHGAFSKSKRLNTTIGFALHSFLLVPYHSFRLTHAQHHKSTNDLERETVFVPSSREFFIKERFGAKSNPQSISFSHLTEDVPIVTLWNCFLHQLVGWRGYLHNNLSGHKGARGFPQHSHFWFGKDSAIFKDCDLWLVAVSDIGCVGMIALLVAGVKTYGWWTMGIYYGIPWMWLNFWISVAGFLQHTDGTIPHFTHSQWTFARGAAATIDRDFGFIDAHFFHNIIGAHVCHHLVSSIPFYHAQEATEAIKKVMGKHYHSDFTTPLLTAFWRNQRDCQFVEETSGMDGSGVFMFRNLHGRGVPPRNLQTGEALTSWPGHIGFKTGKTRTATLVESLFPL